MSATSAEFLRMRNKAIEKAKEILENSKEKFSEEEWKFLKGLLV